MTDKELRIACECVRVHMGAVSMMGREVFHMAVMDENKVLIGTVKCDDKSISRFYPINQ